MNYAKDYCLNHRTIAYTNKLGGLEIKGILHGIYDCAYAVSGAWSSKKNYHCVKINNTASGRQFLKIHGRHIYLDECIRCN